MAARKNRKTPSFRRHQSAEPSRQSRSRGCLGRLALTAFKFAVLITLLTILFYAARAMIYDLDNVGTMPQRSIVYDMDGNIYGFLHGENRILVELDDVSEHFIHALLAREDTRFYKHHGIDPVGIARAIVRNLRAGAMREGASTITQQLARNSFPLGGKNLDRKILEAALAIRMEISMSKDEILEAYVNRIYFGSGLYGVEAASQAYFGTSAANLSVSQGALLAGLIRSPSRFSPFNNLEDSVRERNAVLDRMETVGFLKKGEAATIKRWPVKINTAYKRQGLDDYGMEAVVADLALILADKDREEGGLRIYTTLDPRLMKIAENALEQHLSKVESRSGFPHPPRSAHPGGGRRTDYVQGAVVAIDNTTGGIRAMVGGRSFADSRFNRARLASRQTGSVIKPFVYAAAFGRGLLPGTFVSDGPILPGELRSAPSSQWSPANSDGKFGGLLPLEDGLIRSRNTMTVRAAEFAGLDAFRTLAANAGIDPPPPSSPTASLGAGDTTLLHLTSAYSVFPNHGLRRQPYIIERIDDANDVPVYRAAHITSQAMDPGVAWLVTRTLQKAMETGTGQAARSYGVKFPAAGKTGTTNNAVDAWFAGFSSSLTCAVWVGMDDSSSIMPDGYGSTLALPIWSTIMAKAPPNRYPTRPFQPSIPLTTVSLCRETGQLATEGCRHAGTAYNDSIPVAMVPQRPCLTHAGQLVQHGQEEASEKQRTRMSPTDLLRAFQHLFNR